MGGITCISIQLVVWVLCKAVRGLHEGSARLLKGSERLCGASLMAMSIRQWMGFVRVEKGM